MTGDTVGGVWTFTLELAAALAECGVEVLLAAMGGVPSPSQRAQAGRIPGLRLAPSTCKLEWMDDPWDDVAAAGRWLLRLEDEFRPGVVHLNTYGHGALPWRNPVVLTAHSCVLSWWDAVKGGPLAPRWDRYRREVARSIAAADVLTAPSQAMVDCVAAHYGPGLPEYRVVVPNGRSVGQFRPLRKEPFVLTAGRLWDEAKNVSSVADIAARLPWPVYLAGAHRGPFGGSHNFEGCSVLGWLPPAEMAAWFGRASIYALPARYEPFGLSALEAALSGCALVLGDIPSLREIWRDAAVYVAPDDRARLQSALLELIADPVRRDRIARLAAERAREFTPRRMLCGYLKAYRMAGQRRAACVT